MLGLEQTSIFLVLTPLAAVAGHNWSVFLNFQGGRGVSVIGGALLALSPLLLSAAIAVVVVVSIKVVGIVLIAAFLVLPAAAARMVSRTFATMTIVSIAIGLSTVFFGIYASYYADLPSGPSVILTQTAALALCAAFRR